LPLYERTAGIECGLERRQIGPRRDEQIRIYPAMCPHTQLRFSLVTATGRSARVHGTPAPSREGRKRRRKDCGRPRASGNARFQIVDAHPARHAAVASEQCEMARLPGELMHLRAGINEEDAGVD